MKFSAVPFGQLSGASVIMKQFRPIQGRVSVTGGTVSDLQRRAALPISRLELRRQHLHQPQYHHPSYLGTKMAPTSVPTSTPTSSKRRAATAAAEAADRSAKKKVARAILRRAAADSEDSEDEELEGAVQQAIYESSAEEDVEDVEDDEENDDEEEDDDALQPQHELEEASTPSKRRGRPPKSSTSTPVKRRRKRASPSPDAAYQRLNLPPHELYFSQARTSGAAGRTSNNTFALAGVRPLDHEEYFSILQKQRQKLRRQQSPPGKRRRKQNGADTSRDEGGGGVSVVHGHAEEIRFLQDLHARLFPQWRFELANGFSPCLFGYGSKKALLLRFASFLYEAYNGKVGGDGNAAGAGISDRKIVIINGYVRAATSLREILSLVCAAISPPGSAPKLPGGHAAAMLQHTLGLLSSLPPGPPSSQEDPGHQTQQQPAVTLLINSMDAPPLRRPATQAALAALAAHPRVALACTVDTPDFALLWDAGQRSRFRFVFHDCTTFVPFAATIAATTSAEENGDGMADGGGAETAEMQGGGEIDVVDDVHVLLGRRARRVGGKDGVAFVLRSLPENARNLFSLFVAEVLAGLDGDGDDGNANGHEVEYKSLYNKAVEEFICSSEMAFRTLLKE